MATIVIFDDDPTSLARLSNLIESYAPADEHRTVLPVTSLPELEQILSDGIRVDILVADIVIGEGQPSGIDIVQALFPPSCGTQVIYVSGFLEQATETYRTSHVYFLLKPVDPVKLTDALRRAYEAIPQAEPSMLRIKCGHKERLVAFSAIRYLESRLHKVCVHCGKRSFETYAKLDDLQGQLPAHFSRCHRSFLVNLSYVSSLEGTELTLRDGIVLPISRRRTRQVQHDLLALLSARGQAPAMSDASSHDRKQA